MYFVGAMFIGIGLSQVFHQPGLFMVGFGAGFILEGYFGPQRYWRRRSKS